MKHCVLGILDTIKGHHIAEKMLEWLEPQYEVMTVTHDGSMFEWPALSRAQQWSLEIGKPVLYLHTRGAVNIHFTTEATHRMWREQFGQYGDRYFNIVENLSPVVACPFTGDKQITWYNGFVANPAAWRNVIIPSPNEAERHAYERMFCGTKVEVVGILSKTQDNDKEDSVIAARDILMKRYKDGYSICSW